MPRIGQWEALWECCSKFKLCIPRGLSGRQQRISLLYNPAGLLLNLEINKNPSCILLHKNKYWYVNPIDDWVVESSQDEVVNNNINTDSLDSWDNNDVKIGRVGVVIAMYENKEKVFLFHVEAENTIYKDIFSIIDDRKLKYSAKYINRS